MTFLYHPFMVKITHLASEWECVPMPLLCDRLSFNFIQTPQSSPNIIKQFALPQELYGETETEM